MIFKNRSIPPTPDKYPLYYGWIILAIGTIGIMMSIPGQTIGVSAFTKPLMEALKISDNQIAIAYFLGTGINGFILTYAGKAYDKYGARIVGLFASLFLGMVLFSFSKISYINSGLINLFGGAISGTYLTVALMTLMFLLLRFSGQGITTMVARNMIMKWFDKNRGFANGIAGMATSFGFNFSPAFFAFLLARNSLSVTYSILAIAIGIVFSCLVFLFYYDNPWKYNLKPYDKNLLSFIKKRTRNITVKDFNLKEVKSTRIFWMFNLTITVASLFVSAQFFFNELIFESAGLSSMDAISIFLPIALITVVINTTFSLLSDFMKLKNILYILQLALLFTTLGVFLLNKFAFAPILIIIGIGFGGGTFSILITISWPRFFGLKNLGAISGFSMAWWVVGSAVGPLLFSVINYFYGDYSYAGLLCFIIVAVLISLSIKITNTNEEAMFTTNN